MSNMTPWQWGALAAEREFLNKIPEFWNPGILGRPEFEDIVFFPKTALDQRC